MTAALIFNCNLVLLVIDFFISIKRFFKIIIGRTRLTLFLEFSVAFLLLSVKIEDNGCDWEELHVIYLNSHILFDIFHLSRNNLPLKLVFPSSN